MNHIPPPPWHRQPSSNGPFAVLGSPLVHHHPMHLGDVPCLWCWIVHSYRENPRADAERMASLEAPDHFHSPTLDGNSLVISNNKSLSSSAKIFSTCSCGTVQLSRLAGYAVFLPCCRPGNVLGWSHCGEFSHRAPYHAEMKQITSVRWANKNSSWQKSPISW